MWPCKITKMIEVHPETGSNRDFRDVRDVAGFENLAALTLLGQQVVFERRHIVWEY